MRTTIQGIALSLILASGTTVGLARTDEQPAPNSASTSVVTGVVLKIEGDFYVVKDSTGKEVRLHISKDTEFFGPSSPGDQIEAHVTAEGHAKSILVLKAGI